jgi:hypothetical protein
MNGPHPQRCRCAECLSLDERWPNDGFQLRLPGTHPGDKRTKEESDDGTK